MQINDIKTLLKSIDKWDNAYYNDSISLVTDQVYDGAKDQLRSFSVIFQPSSTVEKKLVEKIKTTLARVGAAIPKECKWEKVDHEVAMTSLNKVNLPNELMEWHKKCNSPVDVFCTEKLDGLSMDLKYENGKLIQALSRGDGIQGENITRNAIKMKGVHKDLRIPFSGHIRGEIILFHSAWKTYFPEMSNPRNAASGLTKRLDGAGTEHLTFIAYTIEGEDFATEVQAIEYIKQLGFWVPNYTAGSIKIAISEWHRYMTQERNNLEYDIDGLVVRINDLTMQFSLGEEAHRPKGAIAFKFDAPQAETKVTDIICQVGDTGRITPVVEFNEVELLGSKITRASLHNFSLVKELGINIGATIIVERCNDVIPGVKQVTIPINGYFKAPDICPVCGGLTVQVGEYLMCSNKKSCPAQVLGRLNKWIKELNILEWGETILIKLIESGLVKDVADLYKLKTNDIEALDRMGEKSAANLIAELDKYRCITLESFFGGLCIEGIATSTTKSIIDAGYNTFNKIIAMSTDELERVPGFGEKRAQQFHSGLIENADRIENILSAGVTIKDRVTGTLTGKSFCVTGSTNIPRAKLHKMIEEAGGEVKKTVGKGLSYLVLESENSTSSKAQSARKNSIELISEEKLLEMIKLGC
jgi:DNA ligase (NAD+)